MKLHQMRAEKCLSTFAAAALALHAMIGTAAPAPSLEAKPATSDPIPWNEIGARAAAPQYTSDGLSITPAAGGARLRCLFQQLEAEATSTGLWVNSTAPDAESVRFRLAAGALGRANPELGRLFEAPFSLADEDRVDLPELGDILVEEKIARFIRPGLIEEYSVRMDGIRQDFVVLERPRGKGELKLILRASGASVETAPFGARLVLESSGRKLAYSRLHVTDAMGRELPARMEIPERPSWHAPVSCGQSLRENQGGLDENCRFEGNQLAILVNDAGAVYPIRIDPTFSDENWISMGGFAGANDGVYAAVVDASGNLYIGGSFTIVGNITVNRVAKWDGSHWSALGSGINDGHVSALAVVDNDLYAGGSFTTAGGAQAKNIAKWDGSQWSALGAGVNDGVFALEVSGSELYVGGNFTTAGGVSAERIAKWDGSQWSHLGAGMNGMGVWALAISGTDLYAGGGFTTAGGVSVNHIAKWNGTVWSALGSGVDETVHALAVAGGDLYAGGRFARAGGVSASHIAKWNGTVWSALGSGMNHDVYDLAVSGSGLYVGGNFTTAGGASANYVAKWDGHRWSALDSGLNNMLRTLAVSGGKLYAGGWFTLAGGEPADYLAKWTGSEWTALGSKMNKLVPGFKTNPFFAMAVSGSDLYVGGGFTELGGIRAHNVAKWTGSEWLALGPGLDRRVSALAVSGSDLYAATTSTTSSNRYATEISKWNGTQWSALGSEIDGWVFALAVAGSDLYAAGEFTMAGGMPANGIAKWNGSQWSALGSGLDIPEPGWVSALVAAGANVYAGANFEVADAGWAYVISMWDGSGWSIMESQVGGSVHALAVSGTDLYAASTLHRWATPEAAEDAGLSGEASLAWMPPPLAPRHHRVARWNGSRWSELGSGFGGEVYSLAVSGNDVYAAGFFGIVSRVAANNIAKWDGSKWSPLGSGLNNSANVLAVSGSHLFAGGWFTMAGGKVSPFLARAVISQQSSLPILVPRLREGAFGFTFAGEAHRAYTIQSSTDLRAWTDLETLTPESGNLIEWTARDPHHEALFYRVKTQ